MYRYAERKENIKPSPIRALAKLVQDPEIISFAGGMPAPELFPIEEMAEVTETLIKKCGRRSLQYSGTDGIQELKELIVERMKRYGVTCEADNVMITSGSQQGLEMTGKMLIDKDDVVICENPSYVGALNAFGAYAPKMVPVEMDDEGMRMDCLEQALKGHPGAKFIYTIPNYQNPTGVTLSVSRRKTLVRLSNDYGVPIVEDNAYMELGFDERAMPVKSFDQKDEVIFLGSFSKVLCPGLRVGWIVAPKEVLGTYNLIKQGADLHTNTLAQMQIVAFAEKHSLDQHIIKIKKAYQQRRDQMLKEMEACFPDGISWTSPKGGMFIWVTLPQNVNVNRLFEKALEKKVAFVPGNAFFPGDNTTQSFRLNYGTMNEKQITEGIHRLAAVLAEEGM